MKDGRHPNLHLLLETKVVRVLFDEDKRAVGVEYVPNRDFQPFTGLPTTPSSTVKARKLVVVASGALGTPQILERSGVGDSLRLSEFDIPIIADLKGVGENYQDHYLLGAPYKSSLKPEETLDGVFSGRLDIDKARKERNPILGWNGFDVNGKIRPTEAEVEGLGGEFKTLWDRDFKQRKQRPLMLMGLIAR